MPVVESRTDPAVLDRVAGQVRERPWVAVVAMAGLACLLGWVPFMGRPLSPDEGGLLMVAGQWGPGDSLYGDYWVDRPPVLIAIFALADLLGGAWGVRVLGVLAVLASVLLAGLLGRLVAAHQRTAALLPAATAAILLATPLFGGGVVDAEVLGLPLVLTGMIAAVASGRAASSRQALWWSLAAGAAGAGAALTKQNLLDVFILVSVMLVTGGRHKLATALGTAVGAAVAAVSVLGIAAALGTNAGELWTAVVSFRGDAARVLLESPYAGDRLRMLLLALLGTGAPMLAGVLLLRLRRQRRAVQGDLDLRWPVVVVLAWEATAVLMGGSYWAHYLTGLVPGLVLLAAVSGLPDRFAWRSPFALAYDFAALSTLCVIGWVAVNPMERPEHEVGTWLAAEAEPGDTAMVAFGVASLLQTAGLDSPYPHLWSLPVRVHDPQLHDLAALLAGPERPTWLVVGGESLGTWGVDATAAEPFLDAHYEYVENVAGYSIYREAEANP